MKRLLICTLIFTSSIYANDKKICGAEDNRILSFENPIGRSSMKRFKAGCTITMISDSCAISVGHCVDAFEVIQFNVPLSVDTEPTMAGPEDIYERNKDFMRYSDNGKGDDWAVIKMKKNPLTGLFPGQAQGFYPISKLKSLKLGMEVRITGFGEDALDRVSNFAQQSHHGVIKKLGGFLAKKSKFGYDVDTTIGSSGSPVILANTNEIIGVHSHGTCGEKEDFNQGTLITKNKSFQFAIQQCLNFKK
jgi:V8-like Glu-specific endopeptidase